MTTIYRKTDSVVTREIAGETMLIPVTGSLADMQQIFALDEVSAAIWNSLDGRRTVEDIAMLVVETFDVAGDTAVADAQEFIDQLCGAGLAEAV